MSDRERPADDGRPDGERPAAPPDGDPFGFAPDERDRHGDAPDLRRSDPEPSGDDPDEGSAAPAAAGDRQPPADDLRPVPGPRVQRGARMGTVGRAVGVRYTVLVAILMLVLVSISLLTRRGGDGGAGTIAVGSRLPPFAAPLATAPKLPGGREDVNLASRSGQGQAGKHPACSIRNRSVITSCALLKGGRPLVLVMFTNGMDPCVRVVDELDRLRRETPRIATLAVAFGGEHDGTAELVRRRRWTLPVAYDRDGALGARLGMPVCPFVIFVGADGKVSAREVGTLDADALRRGIRRLVTPPAGAPGVAQPGR